VYTWLQTIGMAWEEAKESAAKENIGVEVWPNVSTTQDYLSLSKTWLLLADTILYLLRPRTAISH